jgi:DNA-binding beta-propeller fold protein YncE
MTAEATILPAGASEALEDDPGKRRRRRKFLLLLGLLITLLALLGLAIWYLLFRQPIPLPLPLIPPTAIPAYTTSIYGTDGPVGVAVSRSGDRIYVADAEGERVVRVFDASGAELGVLQPPVETGAEHVPVYIAIDPTNQEVYVSDRPTGAIYVYDRAGTYQREYRPAEAITGWQPLGLAFDAGGSLYVTDLSGIQRVLKFDPTGKLVLTLGADEGLLFPNGVAVDKNGRVYVTDSNNGRLLVFEPDGAIVGKIGRGAGSGNLGLPRGIAVDDSGRVFVVDSSAQGVLVYSTLADDQQQPEHRGFFGSPGVADGQFAFPMGIAVDDRGRVYVADTANDRIQVWSY